MNDFLIRDARAEDTGDMENIIVAAFRPAYEGYRHSLGEELFTLLYPDWEESKRSQIRVFMSRKEGSGACVVEKGAQIIGFITYMFDPSTRVGEIWNNGIQPGYQGLGIGKLMYNEVFNRLKSCGMEYVKVITGGDPAHEPARRAYEKVGFEKKLETVQYYKKL